MDGLNLLAEARQAGLIVEARGDQLAIRGPRSAGHLALRLIARKSDVLIALTHEADGTAVIGSQPAEQALDDRNDRNTTARKFRPAERISTEANNGEPVTQLTPWPSDLADWALSLTPADLPAHPFSFGQGCRVADPDKFLASLQADVRRGPEGPRAMYGALRSDLENLRRLLPERSADGWTVCPTQTVAGKTT